MEYNSIADIYSANEKFREQLNTTLDGISQDEAVTLPDGEKWTIEHLVEHLWMVEFGTSRLCSRLLESAIADGEPSDGSFVLSDKFSRKAAEIAIIKVEAPERVVPKGGVTVAESRARMLANRLDLEAMRPDLERFDLSAHTFPHPFFGELTASEWLVMVGWHEGRHTKQIERILEKIRA
ncbi:MAG: DinB family protein [Pyrinomonadaceae bacterium]